MVSARVAALHALEDQIVARLHRQMEMRHQPLLFGDGGISMSSASMESSDDSRSRFIPGTSFQQLAHQRAQAGRARQIGAIGRSGPRPVSTISAKPFSVSRRASAITSPMPTLRELPRAIRDDAEGAAMIAAILHLQEGPVWPSNCPPSGKRSRHAHDVIDPHALPTAESRHSFPLSVFPGCPAPGPLPPWRHRFPARSGRRSR
jgi:hypothetical protein